MDTQLTISNTRTGSTQNPHCPTMHFNYRYFETEGGVWWFGGGMDITPSYLDEDDMKYFHGTLKEVRLPFPVCCDRWLLPAGCCPCPTSSCGSCCFPLLPQNAHACITTPQVCDRHDPAYYAKFKKWADEYFVIKHRGETRGLGGIFFDDQNDKAPEKHLAFSQELLNTVTKAYLPIIEKCVPVEGSGVG